MKDIIQTKTGSIKKRKCDSDCDEDARSGVQLHLEDANGDLQVIQLLEYKSIKQLN